MSVTTCPVYTPNLEEFSNFNAYVTKISNELKDSASIVKIIPPKDFFKRDYSLECLNNCIKIEHPVKQLVNID